MRRILTVLEVKSMAKRTAAAVLFCLLMSAWMLSGCGALPLERNLSPIGGDSAASLQPEKQSQLQNTYTLYFGYTGQNYLVAEQRTLSIADGKQVEAEVVRALINGPAGKSGEIQPLINTQTRVLSVTSNKDYIYITLSKEFLEPVNMPSNWQEDEALTSQVYLKRRLAVYSIVNTVTELGKFSRVQLLVDVNGTGEGQRPTRQMMGFVNDGTDPQQLMEPLMRENQLILGPSTMMELVLTAFGNKEWKKIDGYIAVEDPNVVARPDSAAMIAALSMANLTLLSHTVEGEQVAIDGQSAVVTVSYEVQSRDGNRFSNAHVPLRMIRENGLWKVSYYSIYQLLDGVQS